MVTLAGDVLGRYERFSLYNSPYPAHDRGCAVDLYPGEDVARSPLAGEILETQTVRCPQKPYAVEKDHLILLDCEGVVARILHVDPSVEAGESISVGDPLGTLIRSGFFGQWVDNHLHVGFRRPDQNLKRASGSLPLELSVPVEGVRWDGTGEIIEVGPTHVLLDSPDYAGEGFAALASDDGVPLDGGLPHYSDGGVLAAADGEVSLLGTPLGTVEGRELTWADIEVRANGHRASGLSLFASQVPFGAKVVFHDGHDFAVGETIEVSIARTEDPIRLD